jgi:hypothetical protein
VADLRNRPYQARNRSDICDQEDMKVQREGKQGDIGRRRCRTERWKQTEGMRERGERTESWGEEREGRG